MRQTAIRLIREALSLIWKPWSYRGVIKGVNAWTSSPRETAMRELAINSDGWLIIEGTVLKVLGRLCKLGL